MKKYSKEVKNNNYNNNNKKSFIVMGLIAVFIVFVGWALSKAGNSPAAGGQNPPGELNSLLGKPMPGIQLTDKDGQAHSLQSP